MEMVVVDGDTVVSWQMHIEEAETGDDFVWLLANMIRLRRGSTSGDRRGGGEGEEEYDRWWNRE